MDLTISIKNIKQAKKVNKKFMRDFLLVMVTVIQLLFLVESIEDLENVKHIFDKVLCVAFPLLTFLSMVYINFTL